MQMNTSMIQSVILAEHTGPLEAVLLPDNHDGASVRSLCAFLQVDRAGQLARIKHNKALAPGLVLVDVLLPDGVRALSVLRSEYIALFVATLHIKRLSKEAQANAAILQERASTAITRAFQQPHRSPEPQDMPQPIQETSSTLTAFTAIQQGFDELKEHIIGMDRRIIILEQERLGRRVASGARLSAVQIGQLFMQLTLLRKQTGISIEEAERILAAQFEVAHIIDIDAAQWAALHQAIRALFDR